MGEDDDDGYRRSLSVDKVHVEVVGPSPGVVDEMFEETVEEAFARYDEHVADGGGGYHD